MLERNCPKKMETIWSAGLYMVVIPDTLLLDLATNHMGQRVLDGEIIFWLKLR